MNKTNCYTIWIWTLRHFRLHFKLIMNYDVEEQKNKKTNLT